MDQLYEKHKYTIYYFFLSVKHHYFLESDASKGKKSNETINQLYK